MTTLNASETEGQMRLEARLIEADQLTRALSSCLMRGEDSLELVPRLIQKILVTESWKARQRHGEVVKHARFIDYLTTTPPEGLGVDPVRIKRLLWREPRILAMFERAIAEGVTQGTRTDLQPRNNVTKLVRGNSHMKILIAAAVITAPVYSLGAVAQTDVAPEAQTAGVTEEQQASASVPAAPAEVAAVQDYSTNPDVGVPVFPFDITDRPYAVVGEVKAKVRKGTIFSKDPSQQKIYNELWERGQKLGADAVIKAQYGDAHVTAFSWGSSTATGTAIKFTDKN